ICIPVWFDAWRYAQSDALWRALLLSVVEGLRQYVLSDDERIKAIIARRAAAAPETESGDTGPEALKKERERQGARLDDLVDSLYRVVDREELGGIEIQWDKAGKLVLGTAIRAGFQMIPILGTLEKAVEKAREKAGEADYGDAIFDIF